MTREQFFKKYQDAIFNIARIGGKRLQAKLIQILKRMKSERGVLVSSPKNNAVIKQLFKAIKDYMKQQGTDILKFSVTAFDELLEINSKYFGVNVDDFKTQLYDNLGIKDGKNIVKNSTFARLIEDTGVSKSVLFVVNKAIRGKESLETLISKITNLFTPTTLKNPSVLVTQLVKNGGFNYLQIQDRMIARAMANEVGFTHGVYAHTIKNNTRSFCRQRANRIYTISFIREWDDLGWSGKYTNNHKCETDCGGFSCRGHWNWVSKETAERIASQRNKPINTYN